MLKPEPTKRELDSQRKKETIFRAAMQLFKEYGYDNVTMKMISKASGMSEGSIYHFFGEKAGILLMHTRISQQNIRYLIEPTEENLLDPAGTILRYLTAQAAEYEELGQDLASICCAVPAKFRDEHVVNTGNLNSVVRSIEPDLLEYVHAAVLSKRLLISIPEEEFCFILMTFGAGLTNVWVSYGDSYSLTEIANSTFATILKSCIV